MIVLDANILIRAVLGRRVRQLVETYAPRGVRFLAPDVCLKTPRSNHLTSSRSVAKPTVMFQPRSNTCETSISPVYGDLYGAFEDEARERLRGRDEGIGQYWPQRSDWLAPSGARTRTSSEQASRSGLQIVSRSSSKCSLEQSSRSKSESQ